MDVKGDKSSRNGTKAFLETKFFSIFSELKKLGFSAPLRVAFKSDKKSFLSTCLFICQGTLVKDKTSMTTHRLLLYPFPLMLNVKQESCEYQLFKFFD